MFLTLGGRVGLGTWLWCALMSALLWAAALAATILVLAATMALLDPLLRLI